MDSISKNQLFQILSNALLSYGFVTNRIENWLVHEETGFLFAPELLYIEPSENNVSTGSVVHSYHADLFPDAIFEYQYYSFENDAVQSLTEGFKLWIETDLLLLMNALKQDNHDFMTMTIDKEDGKPTKLLFGDVAQMGNSNHSDSHDEDGFCPCCLFTNSIDAFQPLLNDNKNHAIRLFAYKNTEKGDIDADCRVNGEEFEEAKPALINYAKTWQGKDMIFRKQYMLILNQA